MDRIIFHIDVNSAFLSWTAVDLLNKGFETDLREVPSIIGGDKEKRHGIVLAKSIPAKKYGIVTAEPIVSAFRKCPDLLMEPPNFKIYSMFSHALMDYLHTITSDIEQASIDECYLDFTPVSHMYESPVACADMIRRTVKEKFGFTVNVGISDRKVLAKMASDFQKPDKTHTLFSYEIKEKMWPLPIEDLFLCGKSSSAALHKLGINTIGELATANREVLRINLKSMGDLLCDFANGIDDSGVNTEPDEIKGIGNSTTADHDVTDRDEALDILYSLAESVSSRLKKHEFLANLVTVEIKYATFKSVSRQGGTDSPIQTAKAIHEAAIPLFDSLWSGEPIRLLGIRTTKLVSTDEPVQLSLFDMMDRGKAEADLGPRDTKKQKDLEAALSKIRERFGDDAVTKGKVKGHDKPTDK
jgi:DNA polymerase-4